MADLVPRRALLRLVARYPGLHVRELARQANLSEALTLYHLEQLREARLVESVEDGHYRRYYPLTSGSPLEQDRELMAILRRRVPLQIAVYLLEHDHASHQELTDELGLAKSTVSYHTGLLEQARFLVREPGTERFRLAQPERVASLLSRWEPPQDAVARFSNLWERFYRRRRPGRPRA